MKGDWVRLTLGSEDGYKIGRRHNNEAGGGWRGPGVGALSRSHRAVNHPGDRRRRINLANSQLTARLRLRSNGLLCRPPPPPQPPSFFEFFSSRLPSIPRIGNEINRRFIIYSLKRIISVYWKKLIEKHVDWMIERMIGFFRRRSETKFTDFLLLLRRLSIHEASSSHSKKIGEIRTKETGTIRWNKRENKKEWK